MLTWGSRGGVVAVAATMVLVACAGGGGDGHPVSPRRASNTTCLARPAPVSAAGASLRPAFTHAYPADGLSSFPTELVPSPIASGRWYLTLQTGQVISFEEDDGEAAAVVLDIADRMPPFVPGGAAGLLSLAFHPEFSDNGHVFVVYTAPPDAGGGLVSRVARFTMGREGLIDPTTERVILDEHQPGASHTGNHVAFGPDGYLYFSIGDDRRTDVHGQDPTTRQGALLRIDVDGPDPDRGTAYRIPEGNPFADGREGAPEVFAFGLRNPWRFAFDPVDGRLLLADVGQDRVEELNVVEGGENFGWPIREGALCFRRDPCEDEDFVDPLLSLSHPEHRSITPGSTYTRDDIPGLQGRYVLSDFGTGSIYSVDLTDPTLTVRRELEGSFFVVSIARGPDGVMYALRYDLDGTGGIYRLAPPETPGGEDDFPALLSETGCVDPDDPTRPAPGLVPFRPRAELWSDGAEKTRYLAIPDDRRLATDGDGDFRFPEGTVLVKHFGYGGALHETRLFMHGDEGWHGVSYVWNDAGTDARLLAESLDKTLPNGVRWHYPSRSECLTCHTDVAGRSLGLEARQLDWAWDAGPGGADESQLAWLLSHDFFPPDVDGLAELRRGSMALPDPRNAAVAIEQRIDAYLHANCAGCHRGGGPTPVAIDLHVDTPFGDRGLCDVRPQGPVWGLDVWDEQRIVAPGVPEWSTLSVRMGILGLFRMPPVASQVVDQDMVELVDTWIRELPGCP